MTSPPSGSDKIPLSSGLQTPNTTQDGGNGNNLNCGDDMDFQEGFIRGGAIKGCIGELEIVNHKLMKKSMTLTDNEV